MISIFACPKPFTNPHIATIQRNAITSWTLLQPRPEIIIFGEEEGTSDICNELGLRHSPEMARNEHGTPLLNNIFQMASRMATHQHVCFINADIVLMEDFMSAVRTVSVWRQQFLMVGRRWDVGITQPLEFRDPQWRENLKTTVQDCGKQQLPTWIDYFVFPKGLYQNLPAFAIGRPFYDNWLIWQTARLKAPIVDASASVMAVHQNHDYSHVPGGEMAASRVKEGQNNSRLAGGWRHCYTIEDATYRLTPSGIRRNLSLRYFQRRGEMARRWLVDWNRPLRRSLGIGRKRAGS